MTSEPRSDLRWLKVEVEALIEITDQPAVVRAALEAVARGEFTDDGEREACQDDIRNDLVEAVTWLVDPHEVVPDVAGIAVTGSSHSTRETDEAGHPIGETPDFAALFPTCDCSTATCDRCAGYQMTPRTASALHAAAEMLADMAYDDVTGQGDKPVAEDQTWELFDRYPRLTWAQDAVWRRQAARAFDDLAGDLAAGQLPEPTCPGEEMALNLMVEDAPIGIEVGWAKVAQLPEHPSDFDWSFTREALFQDLDILELFDAGLDGIEDPDSDDNRLRGMGDYRPAAWFTTFLNMQPRDGRRPFRR